MLQFAKVLPPPGKATGPHPIALALSVLFTSALASTASADGFSIVQKGGHIITLTSGGQTYERYELMTGSSSGETSFLEGQNFPTIAADDLNLATYFARSGVSNPNWDVHLSDWHDTNGALDDFFVFEMGGNDPVSVRPIFPNGSVGKTIALSGFSSTGYSVPTGLNLGQHAKGIGFSLTDLLDAAGQPLKLSATIAGLRFESAGIDGSVFCAVHPAPKPPKHFLRPPAWVVQPARVWHPLTLVVKGPILHELGESPNPFLDFRLQVLFKGPSGKVYDVPGFYSGNGFGGSQGDVFKVIFTPDEPGNWTYEIKFRSGTDVAISLEPNAGSPMPQDGLKGTQHVLPVDPTAPDFYRWGRLEHVGGHYLKFHDGPYFLKGGVGSPENVLSFFGFDDAQDAGNLGIIHSFHPHISDFKGGDPHFVGNTSGVDSRGIIGGLNYLASKQVNSMFVLLMNLGGDSQDVFPFVGAGGSTFENRHYDTSKLYKWNQFFTHAQRLGVQLHFVLGETEYENESWLSNGALGTDRKLYYREMVARFGHHLAIKWNLSEENDFSSQKLIEFANYIQAIDPYDHPIAVHTHLDNLSTYNALYGKDLFSAASIQYSADKAGYFTEQARQKSAASGHAWVVDMDENGTAAVGLSPNNIDDMRKRVLYDVLFSGGNIEWYLGGQPLPIGGDQDLEDWRTREDMWEQMAYARHFLESQVSFWLMQPADHLLSGENTSYGGGEVFAQAGKVYAVYLPKASQTGTLDLTGAPGTFSKRWFDPRKGVFAGNTQQVPGGQKVSLGSPPSASSEDWVVLVRKL